jgi:hypothetical protein
VSGRNRVGPEPDTPTRIATPNDDDGIQVRSIPHRQLAPINSPPVYEDLSDDEDFVEGVFGQNIGVDRPGEGRRGAVHGGIGFRGYERGGASRMRNVYDNVGYRDANGEQPRRQDYGREESHEY